MYSSTRQGFARTGRFPGGYGSKRGPKLSLLFDEMSALPSEVSYTGGAYRTKYDADGVLGHAPHNLCLRSEDLGTSWGVNNLETPNTNVAVNPVDGATTADELIETTATSNHWAGQSITVENGKQYTQSYFVKANTATWIQVLYGGGPFPAAAFANFDLTNGVAGTIGGDIDTSGIVAVGTDGWYRVWATSTADADSGTNTMAITFINNLDSTRLLSYEGSGKKLYIFGIQLNEGLLGDYVATTTAAVWTPRFDHVLRARTNHLRNNTMQGAVAGTPGTDPTNWSDQINGTTAITVVGTGTEDGIEYIDVRFAGTPNATTYYFFETTTGIAALTDEVWTNSAYMAIVGGSTTNVGPIKLRQAEYTSVPGYISENAGSDIKDELTSTLQRFSFVNTLDAGSTTAYVGPMVSIQWSSGALDITLRIGLPQMERTAAATDAIKTYGGAVTVDEWRDHNYILQSNDLATAWTAGEVTISSDAVTGPAGTNTMDTLLERTATDLHEVTSNSYTKAALDERWTLSTYVRGGLGRDFAVLLMSDSGNNDRVEAEFNVTTGVISITASIGGDYTVPVSGIIDEGDGLYRIWVTATTHSADTVIRGRLRIRASTGSSSYAGDVTKGLSFGSINLHRGSELLDYTATTTAAVAATLEFVPVGLSVYEARTNLQINSELLSDAAWNPTRASVTANQIVAPDGTTTADKLKEDGTGSNSHLIYDHITPDGSSSYTFSVFAKANTRSQVSLRIDTQGFTSSTHPVFDLSRGVVVFASNSVTNTITNVGNGWYRVSATIVSDSASSTIVGIQMAVDGAISYNGDDASSIYIWGYQAEAGASPSPYCKTTTDEVDATADVPTMTGTNFSWFNEGGPGTMLAVATANSINSYDRVWAIGDGSSTDTIEVARNSSDTRGFVEDNNVTGGSTNNSGAFVQDIETSIAFAWDTNDASLVTDGGTPNTDTTSVVLPTSMTSLTIGDASAGSDILNGNIARIIYWNRRLPDGILTSLTVA